jgi:hypothetical protein
MRGGFLFAGAHFYRDALHAMRGIILNVGASLIFEI